MVCLKISAHHLKHKSQANVAIHAGFHKASLIPCKDCNKLNKILYLNH